MKYHRIPYTTAALTIVLSAALSACGSDSDNDDTDANNPDQETPFTPVDPDTMVPPGEVDPNTDNPATGDPLPQPNPVSQQFTNQQLWFDAVPGMVNQVDFESESTDSRKAISGNEFIGSAGSPRFSISNGRGAGIEVGDPGGELQSIPPTSGVNTLFMACDPNCEGVVEVSFSQPLIAFGAFFIDVEADFATTGFTLSESAATPEFAFTEPQGQSSQAFLGFTSATPFTSVYIHFSTGPTNDGAAMDDMVYVFDNPQTAVQVEN